jgi:hypothetical protein
LGRFLYQILNRFISPPQLSSNFNPVFAHALDFNDPKILKTANHIVQGNYSFLGIDIKNEVRINWHKDYFSGYIWPVLPFYKIRDITPKGVDLKNPWELSSFFHLFPVAIACSQSNDRIYVEFIINQIMDWNKSNPCAMGVNWSNPMIAAFRLILLVEIFFLIQPKNTDENFKHIMDIMIWQHLLYLANNLENLGISPANHFLADLMGMLWGTLYFSRRNIFIKNLRKWTVYKLELEMKRQINQDGFSFEGSTSYHRLVTEIFLFSAILMKSNKIGLKKFNFDRLYLMLKALNNLTLPNSYLPHIGDNDDCRIFYGSDYFSWNRHNPDYLMNIGGTFFQQPEWNRFKKESKELENWIWGNGAVNKKEASETKSLNLNKSISLEETGLYVCKNKNDCLIINIIHPGQLDCGHSHNDTLSFILCLDNEEVFIDPGTYVYTRDLTMRNLFRSTAYHNTLEINNEEQWPVPPKAPFKLSKKIKPKVLSWKTSSDEDIFEGEHYGYTRFPEKIIHKRKFHFKKNSGILSIQDKLLNSDTQKYTNKRYTVKTYFHISHDIKADIQKDKKIVFTKNKKTIPFLEMLWIGDETQKVKISSSWQSLRYGVKQEGSVITFETTSPLPVTNQYKINKLIN